MQPEVIEKLRQVNREFYRDFAQPFSATRQRIQPGVKRILSQLPAQVSLLDLGCGNGELWRQLVRSGFRGSYVGLDFSEELLAVAKNMPMKAATAARAWFVSTDLSVEDWLDTLPPGMENFDYVLAFAVLHHIPGSAARLNILQQVRRVMSQEGAFVLSVWQFQNSPRLLQRVQPWELIDLADEAVDPGDTLLDWRSGGSGLRYVHLFNQAELAELAKASGFRVVETFYADGEEGNLGLYQVWEE